MQRARIDRTINLDIEEAMLHGDLNVYYQPIFDIQAKRPQLVEAEAFARWDHPDLGILTPTDLNIWEASDQITMKLTDYVLQRVIEQQVVWKKQKISLPVSVHFTTSMLNDYSFPQRLADLMAEHCIDHRFLNLELCEPRPAIFPDIALKILDLLTNDGFHAILGNFARNAVFLGGLTQTSWAGIKLDAEITKNLLGQRSSLDLVSGIICLIHALGIQVYAENVETVQSASILRSLGCDKAQGWCFGKPMSARDLNNFLIEKNGTVEYALTAEMS